MRFNINAFIFCCISILSSVYSVESQTNLVTNGDFQSDSGWNNLGLYNEGSAQSSVTGSAYLIDIAHPGTEPWSVQLTQSNIPLVNGRAYYLSFEISASIDRTVEASISRNGGDWISYSGRDTVNVSTTSRTIEKIFIMKSATDSSARIEFNFGKGTGSITLKNVKLTLFTDKVLEIDGPADGELVHAGSPYAIGWSSVNIADTLSIQFSDNGGSSWTTIGKTLPDSIPFIWKPSTTYSPWCKVRIVSSGSSALAATTQGFFEIAPNAELIKNGSFVASDSGWNLGVHQGVVEHEVDNYGGYRLNVVKSGTENWQIQLTQDHIVLEKGKAYRYSFSAHSEMSSTIDVNIGLSREPYSSYIDSVKRMITLSQSSKQYVFVFTMEAPTDSNVRFEINCGKAVGEMVFDDISMVPEYKAPLNENGQWKQLSTVALQNPRYLKGISLAKKACGMSQSFRVEKVFDLKGRMLSGKSVTVSGERHQNAEGSFPAGIYLRRVVKIQNRVPLQ